MYPSSFIASRNASHAGFEVFERAEASRPMCGTFAVFWAKAGEALKAQSARKPARTAAERLCLARVTEFSRILP